MKFDYVKWFISTSDHNILQGCSADNVIAIKPDLVLSDLIKNKPGYFHYKCPAFTDTLKNTYLVRSPIDISIKVDPTTRSVKADRDQYVNEKYITKRGKDSPPDDDMIVSINHYMMFITDNDIELEQISCLYHTSDWVEKTQVVTGKFNIKKWMRPIECAGIIKNSKATNTDEIIINIKRGDPLFYIRFHPKNNNYIKLEQEFDLSKIVDYIKLSYITSEVKYLVPWQKLSVMYALFERFRPKKFFKKCPFNFRN